MAVFCRFGCPTGNQLVFFLPRTILSRQGRGLSGLCFRAGDFLEMYPGVFFFSCLLARLKKPTAGVSLSNFLMKYPSFFLKLFLPGPLFGFFFYWGFPPTRGTRGKNHTSALLSHAILASYLPFLFWWAVFPAWMNVLQKCGCGFISSPAVF